MLNYVQPGDTLDLTSPAGGVTSGQATLFGSIFGVAATDAAAGKKVAVKVEGVFILPKATGAGIDEGAKVYWITADKKVTATASGNTLIGNAVEAAVAGATEVAVRLSN
jgi:predicted RecA/RadA family phage recombinase